ncbi:MAG: translation elongation factor Ts [Defluviitaleaceae bacterium]|nr:translation elongation factor Ts [Defluviitaleaceae bacterium]
MAVTAALVKELREMTGAGMVDCKNALVEADGSIERAVELLREKGLAAAAKKAGRIASEGLSHVYIDNNGVAAIVEVNSETDFVAKNAEFRTYVQDVAEAVIASSSKTVEEFSEEKWLKDNSITVKEALSQKIAVIGENLNIRRFDKIAKSNDTTLVSYIHAGGKVAVLIEIKTTSTDEKITTLGKDLAMQIAAMNPKFVTREEVSADFIEKEREILTQQALNEGKPEEIARKMVEGRLNKGLKEFCLVEQEYVKDGEMTVKQYIESVAKQVGSDISVIKFVRYETGEGIEKKEENFAEEVNKVMGK